MAVAAFPAESVSMVVAAVAAVLSADVLAAARP